MGDGTKLGGNSSLNYAGAKSISYKMPRQFQNFSVCIRNTVAKNLPKIEQKPLYFCTSNGFGTLWYFAKESALVFLTAGTTCST